MSTRRSRVIIAAVGGVAIVVVVAVARFRPTSATPPLATPPSASAPPLSSSAPPLSSSAPAPASPLSTPTPSAVASSPSPPTAPSPLVTATPPLGLDESSAGKSFPLAKGQTVTLLLSASPTSGFDWAVSRAPAALGPPTLGFVPASGEAMGAGGKRRIAWTLTGTLPPGDHAVELGYQRSFEQGVAAFKTFRFTVHAR